MTTVSNKTSEVGVFSDNIHYVNNPVFDSRNDFFVWDNSDNPHRKYYTYEQKHLFKEYLDDQWIDIVKKPYLRLLETKLSEAKNLQKELKNKYNTFLPVYSRALKKLIKILTMLDQEYHNLFSNRNVHILFYFPGGDLFYKDFELFREIEENLQKNVWFYEKKNSSISQNDAEKVLKLVHSITEEMVAIDRQLRSVVNADKDNCYLIPAHLENLIFRNEGGV